MGVRRVVSQLSERVRMRERRERGVRSSVARSLTERSSTVRVNDCCCFLHTHPSGQNSDGILHLDFLHKEWSRCSSRRFPLPFSPLPSPLLVAVATPFSIRRDLKTPIATLVSRSPSDQKVLLRKFRPVDRSTRRFPEWNIRNRKIPIFCRGANLSFRPRGKKVFDWFLCPLS